LIAFKYNFFRKKFSYKIHSMPFQLYMMKSLPFIYAKALRILKNNPWIWDFHLNFFFIFHWFISLLFASSALSIHLEYMYEWKIIALASTRVFEMKILLKNILQFFSYSNVWGCDGKRISQIIEPFRMNKIWIETSELQRKLFYDCVSFSYRATFSSSRLKNCKSRLSRYLSCGICEKEKNYTNCSTASLRVQFPNVGHNMCIAIAICCTCVNCELQFETCDY
jgi:hypothetical protein